ncbi:MAG: FecR domain-containing protein [Myxococcales bacterium]|nr:FecR domain-containing protein [Myxococcales bacterium]
MSEPETVESPLSVLREPLPAESSEIEAATRARVLGALHAGVEGLPLARARARRRQRVASVAGATALAAAAALVIWIPAQQGAPSGPRVEAAAPAAPPALRVQQLEAPGAEADAAVWIDAAGASHALQTSSGAGLPADLRELRSEGTRVALRTAGGASVDLAPASLLALAAESKVGAEVLKLQRGEVECAVPPLGPAGRFSVHTPDARVVVHGTRFRVGFDTRTCVRVSEGLVAVHHERGVERLRAGEQWGCEQEAPERAEADRTKRKTIRARRAAESRRAKQAVSASGTLEAENALLRDALLAERSGETARSRRLFEALLKRHPDSPLATEARAGLARTRAVGESGAR